MLVEKPITMTTAEEVERLAEVRRHLRYLRVLSRCQQLALYNDISRKGKVCGGEHPPFLCLALRLGLANAGPCPMRSQCDALTTAEYYSRTSTNA